MKILVVDDEDRIAKVVREYMVRAGYDCDCAADGIDALEKAREQHYDFFIVDLMMPRLDGYSTIERLRERTDVPIIVLSARSEEYDKLKGFSLGIDDYVIKPFSPAELVARVKAVMSRYADKKESVITYNGLEIDVNARKVSVDGNEIYLTHKEYDLLLYLAKNDNVALSREDILKQVWGYEFFGEDRTVDTHIKTLRANLGDKRVMIETVRGMGYRFNSRGQYED